MEDTIKMKDWIALYEAPDLGDDYISVYPFKGVDIESSRLFARALFGPKAVVVPADNHKTILKYKLFSNSSYARLVYDNSKPI